MKNSSHTGRAPRSLEDAFGPYQRQSQIETESTFPNTFLAKLAYTIVLAAIFAAIFI